MLVEKQAHLDEQITLAKYESARKVQRYYLKCLHQLVNGAKVDESECECTVVRAQHYMTSVGGVYLKVYLYKCYT